MQLQVAQCEITHPQVPSRSGEDKASLGELRIEDIIEWDVVNWSNALSFWTKHSTVAVTREARALELGTRRGGGSLWLASLGFNVVCSDIDYRSRRRGRCMSHTV